MLKDVLLLINEFCISPKFTSDEKELLEVYFNNYCTLAQTLLIILGPAITKQYATDIVYQVEKIFNTQSKVLSGGLLVINGLICAL